MYDIFSNVFDLDTDYINRAYSEVEDEMRYIDMKNEADDILEEVKKEMEKDNPFCTWQTHQDLTPTRKVIRMIYEHAERAIKAKYPYAVVDYVASDYNARFDVSGVDLEEEDEE